MADYETLTDVIVRGLFAVSVAVSAGVASVSLLDVSLANVVYSMDPFSLDWASLISIAVVAYGYLSTMPSLSRMTAEKTALIDLTIGIIILGMLHPGFASNSAALGLTAVGVSAGGYWALQYSR